MPRFSIPNPTKKLWSGIWPGEDFGNIFYARSIDLERNKGKVSLADSYSGLVNSSQVGFGSLVTPIGFTRSSADGTDRWWANAGVLFKTSGTNPTLGWAADAIVSTPGAPLYDIIDFGGNLIVPTSTNLDRLVGGTWTNNWWSSLSGASALQALPHRFFILAGALCVTDGRFINDYDGTLTRDPALTLPAGFQANWGVTSGELAFIGGLQTGGGEAYVYTWDRIAVNYISRYPIGDSEALCGFVADSVYIVTKKGLIKRFNGSGFEYFAEFPTVEAQGQLNQIHPNGVSVSENIVKLMVDFGTINNTRYVSGIWNLDITTKNLYHAGSVRNTSDRDYSQAELAEAGALKQTIVGQGLFLIGARVYTTYSSASRYGIFNSDESSTSNQGFLITVKLRATNIQRFWRLLFVTMRRMTNSADRLRVAVSFQNSANFPAYETITWLNANSFSASNADISAGDFVEVIAGENAGAIARILTYTGGTVTIDRSLFSSTAISRVRYHRFVDLGNVSSTTIQTALFHPTMRSDFMQVLIELRGSRNSPVLESLMVDYKDLAQII